MTALRFVIGVDGGGSKTRAVILPLPAAAAERDTPSFVSGPSNLAAVGAERAGDAILRACDGVTTLSGCSRADIAAVNVGVAGFSHEASRDAVLNRMRQAFPNASVSLVPDYIAAFDGALGGQPGIVVIAGTGQIAYGRNAQGDELRAGGYGHLIDDSGSGYGVGRRALAAALASRDGSGAATRLEALVLDSLAVSELSAVVAGVHGGAIDRARIASLAPLVSDAAAEGDLAAMSILTETGRFLATLAIGIATKLWEPGERFDVACAGGLWSSHHALTDAFTAAVAASKRTALLVAPRYEPAIGAALAAAREAGRL
ncbi:MAG: BadF/BadG/BcrA/BcrD ATPase family protein [Capsulimonadaceae bacterium]|nr:BadF/BadG/BcrA/BcrD ATPase family protein [Capsulimonadaceae bacterium]